MEKYVHYRTLLTLAEKYHKNRKICIWKNSKKVSLFKTFFEENGYSVEEIASDNVEMCKKLERQNKQYYIFIDEVYSPTTENVLIKYGYREVEDYLFYKPKPIIIYGNIPAYSDKRGNSITNLTNNVKLTFRGYGSKVLLESDVHFAENCYVIVDSNAQVEISAGTRFGKGSHIEAMDNSTIYIGKSGFGENNKISCGECAVLRIGANSTYGWRNELIVNGYHALMLGEDIMTSRGVVIRCGDGHAIFDVRTKKRRNYNLEKVDNNCLTIGNHVWIGYEGMVLCMGAVGSGCIIGAKSLVKGCFPNNCMIVGTPGKIKRKDVAWSRSPFPQNMERGCGTIYAVPTINSALIEVDKVQMSRIYNINEYLEKLLYIKDYVDVISVKDTAGHKLTEVENKKLMQHGLKVNLVDKHWRGYIAVFDDTRLLYEEIAGLDCSILKELMVDEKIFMKLVSGPLHDGNQAIIDIDSYDYSTNGRGLNIVLWDKKTKQVFDSVCFDTHNLGAPCCRKLFYY